MVLELKYYVPFSYKADQDLGLALKENLLNIEGTAIDTSVNKNKWQVPAEDLDFFVSTLIGAQMRIDHAESAMAVIGKVPNAKNLGESVWFQGEIGEAPIIQKVIRGYLGYVSVNVDSDDVECSVCGKQTRQEGMLVHLCPNAWEIVHKPKVRELSIVASPAYQKTSFKPVGFGAAMDSSQGINFPCQDCQHHPIHKSIAPEDDVLVWLEEWKKRNAEENLESKKGKRARTSKSAELKAKKDALHHEILETKKACLSGEVSELREGKT